MLSALLVALREGVEAALVVGIVLVYLDRTGRRALKRYVWAGVILACATSFAAAYLLQRWKISTDGFEGVLMLAASVLVVTMIVWMNRIARTLKKEIEGLEKAIASKERQLGDETFLARAPEKIVNGLKATLEQQKIELGKSRDRVNELGA